jgi:hypothetical protein
MVQMPPHISGPYSHKPSSPLPCWCHRLYPSGAITTFNTKIILAASSLGGELLNLERPEMGSLGALFFCMPGCLRMYF